MRFFHLSHTDLDGYSCQLITKEYFEDGFFFNANYGIGVKLNIKKILEDILEFKNDEILFFITDLNLTYNESKDLDKSVKELILNGYNIKLQLLDHHATGAKSATVFDWYFLDVKRSASKIVYDYMCEEYKGFDDKTSSWLGPFIDTVNAIDIWLDHEIENFEFGKVLLSMVSQAREVNSQLFPDLNREFRLYLLKQAASYLNEDSRNIKLDDDIHMLKKQFLMKDNITDTIDNLSAKRLVEELVHLKDELTVIYKGHKGLLTYTLGSISVPANAFLKANDDYDFFIDISRKGNASFRADGIVDVSLMAQKLAGGGGHVNASGAKFVDFEESIDFEVVKFFIQTRLDKI